MIRRLICMVYGHKRAVRDGEPDENGIATFRCPRCRKAKTRKVRARKKVQTEPTT